jgi:hypothetical protein
VPSGSAVAFIYHLVAAATVDEVINATSDYVRVWREVLERLPKGCRLEVHDSEGISRTAAVLSQYTKALRNSGATVGHELQMTAEFFAAAADRIKKLQLEERKGLLGQIDRRRTPSMPVLGGRRRTDPPPRPQRPES